VFSFDLKYFDKYDRATDVGEECSYSRKKVTDEFLYLNKDQVAELTSAIEDDFYERYLMCLNLYLVSLPRPSQLK
jgi:hypothetical protein